MSKRYDAIVVGAGPAGSSAALIMAKNNLSVLLIERGKYPGSKNMYGGNIYALPTSKIIPAFWEHAPIERTVVSEELWFLDNDSVVKTGFTGLRFGKAPYSKFTTYRSKFDQWLANQAVSAGAVLRCDTLAVDLIYDKLGRLARKVDGVRLDTGEEIRADVVILAEGVMAFLTQKAGLRKPLMAHDFTHYVKVIFSLPSEKIQDRFNLEKGEGAAIGMIGFPSAGAIGKGGIWTYTDTLALATGGSLSEMVTKGLSPLHILLRLQEHPLIKRLIQGAEIVEYKSHLIPKGGYKKMPTLMDNGVIVCGDAAQMISGRRGTDLAMLTGKMAGETVIEAHAKRCFTKDSLKNYQVKLNQSFFWKDIRNSTAAKIYYEHHLDADYLLTKLSNQLAYQFFDVELKTKLEIFNDLKAELLKIQPLEKTLKDLYHGILNWGVF